MLVGASVAVGVLTGVFTRVGVALGSVAGGTGEFSVIGVDIGSLVVELDVAQAVRQHMMRAYSSERYTTLLFGITISLSECPLV